MTDRRIIISAAVVVAIAIAMNAGNVQATEERVNNPIKLQSAYPFQETVQKLRGALISKGFSLFAEIDQQLAARTVGLDMPPTTLLIYGNPKGGTPLMLAAPDFALELPLKVLVREEAANKVLVVYTPARMLEGRHGLPAGLAEKLAGAEPIIAAAITPSSN